MVRRDFRTPASIPVETVGRCIVVPNSSEWLGLLNAALLMLTEQWRYIQVETTDLTPEEAANAWYAIYVQSLVSDCEGGGASVLLRQNETTPCILERSDDDGVTWVPFADLSLCANPQPQTTTYPDHMRLNPVTGELEYSTDDGTTWHDYPMPAGTQPTQPWTPLRESQPGASDYERRCAAASSAAVSLAQMYSHTYGAIAAGLANTWGQFANFMNGLTDLVFGIQYGAVWDIAKLIVSYEPIVWETNYAAAELTGQQIDDLTCLIFEYTTIDGNGRAQADFGAIRDNVITTLGINPGTAVWTQLNYVQEAGLERMMDVGFGSTNCGCLGPWEVHYDYRTGQHDSVAAGQYPAIYVTGQGWKTQNVWVVNNYHGSIRQGWDYGNTVHHAAIEVSNLSYLGNVTARYTDATTQVLYGQAAYSSSGWTVWYNLNQAKTLDYIEVQWGDKNSVGYLHGMKLRGSGGWPDGAYDWV